MRFSILVFCVLIATNAVAQTTTTIYPPIVNGVATWRVQVVAPSAADMAPTKSVGVFANGARFTCYDLTAVTDLRSITYQAGTPASPITIIARGYAGVGCTGGTSPDSNQAILQIIFKPPAPPVLLPQTP